MHFKSRPGVRSRPLQCRVLVDHVNSIIRMTTSDIGIFVELVRATFFFFGLSPPSPCDRVKSSITWYSNFKPIFVLALIYLVRCWMPRPGDNSVRRARCTLINLVCVQQQSSSTFSFVKHSCFSHVDIQLGFPKGFNLPLKRPPEQPLLMLCACACSEETYPAAYACVGGSFPGECQRQAPRGD